MAPPQFKRFEQLLPQMLAKLVLNTDLSDVTDTSVVKHLLAAPARQLDEYYYNQNLLLQLFSIDSATGDDLDERAKDIQPGAVRRLTAAKATGTVTFSRPGTTGIVTIPIGTRVKTGSGRFFLTTTVGTIAEGNSSSNDVSAIAEQPGASGNVAADTVTVFAGRPGGVESVTNGSSFAHGRDKETDDSFRNRLKAFIRSLARCTVEAIEIGVLGKEDPISGGTILFANVFEDTVNRGNVTLYIDDGTGTAETTERASGTATAADLTWNGTTTVVASGTNEVVKNDFIGLRSDGQLFEVTDVTDLVITIANPADPPLTIPDSGGSPAPSFKNPENLTLGLSGNGSAVGGETRLFLDNKPVSTNEEGGIVSSLRGLLNDNQSVVNPASGQIDFSPPLSPGERVFAEYTYYTGLIAFAQKIVDGDPNDRTNYPGLRAAGVLVNVRTPVVLMQNVNVTVAVSEGWDQAAVRTNVGQAIKDHINGLGISGDVLVAKLVDVIMGVQGVFNVTVVTPSADVILKDDELPRTTESNLTVN